MLDDAITKEAYAETVTRIIDESPDLDLENLTEAQTGEMLAIFLEESIVYRLICDIGRSQTVATSDPARSIEVEQEIYQIVNGMVHSSIVPELTKAMADPVNLNREIQRIYPDRLQTLSINLNSFSWLPLVLNYALATQIMALELTNPSLVISIPSRFNTPRNLGQTSA